MDGALTYKDDHIPRTARSARTRRVLAAVVLLVFLAPGFPSAARAAEKGVVPDLTWGTSPSDQDRTASALADVGARWVRLNANWADAEPSRGSYDPWWFRQYDRAVELARSAGARIILMSYQSPSWASGSTDRETPPKDAAAFGRFMGHLAQRYAGKVAAYEVWNEENISRFWSTGPDPRSYTMLLKAAYPAIKREDPAAKVVFGGLSTNDYRFAEDAYDAGAKNYFDVMSVHPYTCGKSPELVNRDGDGRMTRSSFLGYREVRASMMARGDDKPIWFTEFGWSTTTKTCGVSEAAQAGYLTQAFRLVEADPYVQIGLWYNFRNNWWNHDEDDLEARFGLMRTDFSPKPAYAAFKAYAHSPGGAILRPPISSTTPSAGTARRKRRFRVTVAVRRDRASHARRGHVRRKRWRVIGTVRGATRGHVILRFQRAGRIRRTWVKARSRRARVSRAGRFRKGVGRLLPRGRWRVYAVYPSGPENKRSRSRFAYLRT